MSATTKTPLVEARRTAAHIANTLAPFCDRIEVAGSIRRERPLVGDVEIVALPKRQTDLGNSQILVLDNSIELN